MLAPMSPATCVVHLFAVRLPDLGNPNRYYRRNTCENGRPTRCPVSFVELDELEQALIYTASESETLFEHHKSEAHETCG